ALWFFYPKKFEGWTHLELGAGNYGADGHTQCSLQKTVLMKLIFVSQAKNFIHDLEERGTGEYNPEHQYGILFRTLDELIARHGPVGIFHVNDLYEEYTAFAVDKLKKYAHDKGYSSVIIEPVSGDYQKINPQQQLSKYRRKKYDSLHLKNPEVSFFYEGMDGDHFLATESSRQTTRDLLQNLAQLSEKGLFLFILYHNNFIPEKEQKEFMEKERFYLPTTEWEPSPYIFPEGEEIPAKWGRVFLIHPQTR
ncbi:MAG: hypothetical protein ACRENF_04655, partial [Thermodesulfobacteriota bacterium]